MILKLFISLLVPTLAGWAVIHSLCHRQRLPVFMHLCLAYGLGLGITSLWILVLGVIKIKFSFWTIALPILLITAAGFTIPMLQRNKTPATDLFKSCGMTNSGSKPSTETLILKILLGVLLSAFILDNTYYVIWRAMNIPVYTWDAVATIAYKAKIFYYEQSLPDLKNIPYPAYPLLTPFCETWVAFCLGQWHDQYIKIIFPAAFVSFLGVFYSFCRFYMGRVWSLLGLALLCSANLLVLHATISYRDFLTVYFTCSTIMLILLWARTLNSPLLILAGLFGGCTSFVKFEGTAYLFIQAILFLLLNFTRPALSLIQKWKNILRFTTPSFFICLGYHLYKFIINKGDLAYGTGDKTTLILTGDKWGQFVQIVSSFTDDLFLSGNWGPAWFILILSLFHLGKKWRDINVRILLLGIMLFFGLYAGIALFTSSFYWIAGAGHIAGLSRIFLHFYPLAVLAILFLNNSVTDTKF